MPAVPQHATTVRLADVEWQPLEPGTPEGTQIAALWGDPMTGPYGALLRVPAGFESPMHTHSSDERVVVLKGSSIHWTEHESRDTAPRVAAGDHMMMPAGVKHVSAATPDEDCVEFITQDGRFDFQLAAED